jgi:hypothetical protein
MEEEGIQLTTKVIIDFKGLISFIGKLSTYTLTYYNLVPTTILITLLTNYPYKNNLIFNTPPQDDAYIFIMLILSITLEKSVILNPFVKTSAICSLVPTKGIHIIPSSSLSLMKCLSISTYLVLSCCTGLFAMFIAALLSQYNMMGVNIYMFYRVQHRPLHDYIASKINEARSVKT